MQRTKVEIVIPVFNAEELLQGALNSLAKQTFCDFKVILMDGGSTDGTLDIAFSAKGLLDIDITSERDTSLAHAIAKGLSKTNADIVSIFCADERYVPNALETMVKHFEHHPEAVAIAGNQEFLGHAIDESEMKIGKFSPYEFDLVRHLQCETIWPISTTFFNRRVLIEDLYYDYTAPLCPDYELWARLGAKFDSGRFIRIPVVLAHAFQSPVSTSFNPDSFDQMVSDKLWHLGRFMAHRPELGGVEFENQCRAGIHLWAAEQLAAIGGSSESLLKHCTQALRYTGPSERLRQVLHQSRTGRLTRDVDGSLAVLPCRENQLSRISEGLSSVESHSMWIGAKVHGNGPWTVHTSPDEWGYSAVLNFRPDHISVASFPVQLEVTLGVLKGSIGIGVQDGNQILGEVIIRESTDSVRIGFPFDSNSDLCLILRSGGVGKSRVQILNIQLVATTY